MLTLTSTLRAALEQALTEELDKAKAGSLHETVAARRADLAQLHATADGEPVTGDLLDSAGYLGFVDL